MEAAEVAHMMEIQVELWVQVEVVVDKIYQEWQEQQDKEMLEEVDYFQELVEVEELVVLVLLRIQVRVVLVHQVSVLIY
jgi:hypothetical protein